MKAPRFDYCAPDSVAKAVALLHEYQDEGKVIAGGQSLVPMLNMRLARPEVLIDITRIPRLREAAAEPGGHRYGAAIVHSAFEDGQVPDGTCGLLATTAAGIGYRAVRNRGTLGGSLSHADASAEWPVVMAALDAVFTCESVRGARRVPAREFVLGPFTNALEDDELLTDVRVPALAPETEWGLRKTARKPGEFAESIAVSLVQMSGGVVKQADAWLGAAGDTPRQVHALAGVLRGHRLSEVSQQEVISAVEQSLPDPRKADERYRVHLHGLSVWRSLHQLRPAA